MRVLLLRLGFIHQKNLDGFKAMFPSAVVSGVPIDGDWDLIWIPFGLVDPRGLRAKRIIFGPHNFVFPNPPWTSLQLNDPRVSYNCLCEWNRFPVGDLRLESLPFPVDTDRFVPSGEKEVDCILYVKLRKEEDVAYAKGALEELGLTYTVIEYGSYTEQEYRAALGRSRFGVWVGRHESQGFALQEALSSGVPLLVWDAHTMGEEWVNGPIYKGIEGNHRATSAPYWDARCGMLIGKHNLKEGLRAMRGAWTMYRPREFVLERLSVEACLGLWYKN